jgi:hypothetical protein
LWRRHIRAIKTGAAMNMLGGDQWTGQRSVLTRKHTTVRPTGEITDFARINGGQIKRHIARNRGDAKQVKFRAGKRQQYGNGIILTGVCVDYQFLHHAIPKGTQSSRLKTQQPNAGSATTQPSVTARHQTDCRR